MLLHVNCAVSNTIVRVLLGASLVGVSMAMLAGCSGIELPINAATTDDTRLASHNPVAAGDAEAADLQPADLFAISGAVSRIAIDPAPDASEAAWAGDSTGATGVISELAPAETDGCRRFTTSVAAPAGLFLLRGRACPDREAWTVIEIAPGGKPG